MSDLPLDAQAMLLRFLQSGEVRSARASETRCVNIRCIAATHRDLGAAVESGAFREDRSYRLRGVVLEMPPLRERGEDLPLLVAHVLARLNERQGIPVRGVTRRALRLRRRHPWPGNVRELETTLEEAATFRRGEWITPENLDLQVRRSPDVPGATTIAAGEAVGAVKAGLGWLQREALRIAFERREVRRQDLVAQCRVSRDLARRALAGLAGRRLLRRVGLGRATRYGPPSFLVWLTLMGDAAERRGERCYRGHAFMTASEDWRTLS